MTAQAALLLINRGSRNGTADLESALALLCGCDLALHEVTSDDPRSLAQAISEHHGKVDRVVVGGGDGTLNAVADALIDHRLPLGILPLGTANDLARTLDLPCDLTAAAAVIVAGRTRLIDVGQINGKHFFNVASIGLSTEVARELTQEIKQRWGVLGYPLSLWRSWRRTRRFGARIRCDQWRGHVRSVQISIGNGRHYGGGMTIADDAAIDDGALDLVSVAPRSFWRTLLSSLALRWGRYRDVEQIRHWRGTEIEIETRRPMPINTDGELTTQTPARVRILPKALSVYVP